jgi:perosamine synthetase
LKIPLAKIEFTKDDFDNIVKPLQSGWVVQGHFVKEFEEKWCKFTGAGNSVAVSSCTTALHLSLSACGIRQGDEVIVPSFTWVATANAVEYLNAKPVFCDINLDTFNIDLDSIEKLISKKTKAIIPVHLFGLPVEMDEINNIARKYNLLIVEDAACGFAAKYKGLHVGNMGNTACFSFHPRKAITTGEGGMITTNDFDFSEKLRSMRDHGAKISELQKQLPRKPYLLSDFPYLGYNFRMTDIQASIGSSQMDRANDIFEKRNYIAKRYIDELDKVEWLKKPFTNDILRHGFQAFVCLFENKKITRNNIDAVNLERNKFMDYLFEKGISTRPGTHAVHNLQYYKNKYNIVPESNLNAYIADKCSVAFPIFPSLTDEELNYLIESIKKYKF